MGEQSNCIVTAIFSCLIYSFVTVSLNLSAMKDVLSFPATGKGGFFFNKTFKARRGTVCKLLRGPSNQHGNLIFIPSQRDAIWNPLNSITQFSKLRIWMTSDSNCIQLVLPMDPDRGILVGFLPRDRIGNLCREVSTIIAPLTDQSFGSDSCMKYNKTDSVGYDFRCVLSSVDFKHSRDGYSIEIVVSTINSLAWV